MKHPCRVCPAEFIYLASDGIPAHLSPDGGQCSGGGRPPAYAELTPRVVVGIDPAGPGAAVVVDYDGLEGDLMHIINCRSVDAALGLSDDYIAKWLTGIVQGLIVAQRATESRRTGG